MKIKKSVFLSGPICEETFQDARFGWRKEFADMLSDEIAVYSPLRGIEGYEQNQILTNGKQKDISGIWWVERDLQDTKNCDVLVVNLLGAKQVSIGSVGEMFYGLAFGKPIIVIDDWTDDSSFHKHPFIEKAVYKVVPDLKSAKLEVENLLLPGI